MRRTDPQTVGEIFAKAVERLGLKDTYDEQRACYLWQEVVGATINQYTSSRWIANGVLHVTITSAPLKNELQFRRAQLISHLNKTIGRDVVRDIQFH